MSVCRRRRRGLRSCALLVRLLLARLVSSCRLGVVGFATLNGVPFQTLLCRSELSRVVGEIVVFAVPCICL